MILKPDIQEEHDFSGGKKASIISDKCVSCGRCKGVCQFDAISLSGPANDLVAKTYHIEENACEGCKVCFEVCPVNAIDFKDCVNGKWFLSSSRFGPFVHARLGAAQENSGKLVTLLRNKAKEIAQQQSIELILVDGSPGIGCPVIASIGGADLVVIVTEPTLSGKHDLLRVAELAKHFNVTANVIINKADVNEQIADEIEQLASAHNIAVIGRLKYDTAFTKAQINAQTVVEYGATTPVAQCIKQMWNSICETIKIGSERKS